MEPLSKARIKFIQSLQHKKFRQKYDKFIVEGLKINMELIREKKHLFEAIYVSNPDYLAILENIVNPELLSTVTPQQMSQISQMVTPPGVLAVCELPEADHLPEDLRGLKLFYLDAVRDPGNLGTIIRCADWFGIDQVICSTDTADIYNPKSVQASMGSVARVKVYYTDLVQVLSANEQLYSLAAALDGKDIRDVPPLKEGLIIIGNESKGIRSNVLALAKQRITIPGDGKAESLNAAIATGIILSHLIPSRSRS